MEKWLIPDLGCMYRMHVLEETTASSYMESNGAAKDYLSCAKRVKRPA